MECITCMDERANVKLEPCGHTVTCKECTLPSLVCSGLRCPMCRAVITNIPSFLNKRRHSVVMVTSDAFPHVGVTFKNAPGGVVITKLSDRDLGSHYLRKGDVIGAINGIPAVHHKTMVTLIDACSRQQTRINLERSNSKDKVSHHLRDLANKYHENCESFHPEWSDR